MVAAYAATTATIALIWQLWNAARSRRHQVEIQLIHTLLVKPSGELFRTVFLEVHNRGDHPFRVAVAGISSRHVSYSPYRDGIDVRVGEHTLTISQPTTRKRTEKQTATKNQSSEDQNADPPLPGVVLARDGAMWSVNDDIPDVVLRALTESGEKESISDEVISELSSGLDTELQGWIQLSTGEPYQTKSIRYDWERAARRAASSA